MLLITYYYPPQQAIGGLRPRALAKYLPDYEWETIVLTPRVPNGETPGGPIIRTENRDVLEDLKFKFGLNPRLELHKQLHLPLATKPNSKLAHTKVIDWLKWWL